MAKIKVSREGDFRVGESVQMDDGRTATVTGFGTGGMVYVRPEGEQLSIPKFFNNLTKKG